MTAVFSSVKLTIILLALLAAAILLGAWCPQIAQVGQDKLVEQFGSQNADILIKVGIADIFHSWAFLFLIALLTVNIVFGSFRHVFPKLKLLQLPMPKLKADQILKLPVHERLLLRQPLSICQENVSSWLTKHGYRVHNNDNYVTAESGKYGRLAPTITHIGLLTLLAGLIVSSWTGFSGFKPAVPEESFSFADAQHSQLWVGKLPTWSVRVEDTRREDYDSGEAKQWYSNLSIVDQHNKVLKKQTISVNDPLSYQGVDIYQSSWTLKGLKLHFNGQSKEFVLQPMGKLFAAFLPLPDDAVMIFSVRDQHSPLRIFAKRKDWESPKLITQILPHQQADLGGVTIVFDGTIAQTGLQYKSDPGFPIVFFAFAFIIAGVSLAAIPHRQIWAYFEEELNDTRSYVSAITIGGTTKKGKQTFARQISNLAENMQTLDNKPIPYRALDRRLLEEKQLSGRC